jgi:hypothetical protein
VLSYGRDERDGDRRGRSESRSRRCVVVENNLKALAERSPFPEMVEHALDEIELSVIGEALIDPIADAGVVVETPNVESLSSGDQRRISVAVDRRAQDGAASFVAIGGNVGAASAKTYSQRSASADFHSLEN